MHNMAVSVDFRIAQKQAQLADVRLLQRSAHSSPCPQAPGALPHVVYRARGSVRSVKVGLPLGRCCHTSPIALWTCNHFSWLSHATERIIFFFFDFHRLSAIATITGARDLHPLSLTCPRACATSPLAPYPGISGGRLTNSLRTGRLPTTSAGWAQHHDHLTYSLQYYNFSDTS